HHHRAGPGRMGPGGQLLQDVDRALVVEVVDGVQAEPVHAVAGQPVLGVVEDEPTHEVRPGAVQVDGVTPGGGGAAGEVGAELAQVVPFRPEVVVDHVQDHGQPRLVAGVDEAAQPGRAAEGGVDRGAGDCGVR